MQSRCGEADAFFDQTEELTQHKMAYGVINSFACRSAEDDIWWLDIGCGKGQMLTLFDRDENNQLRNKVTYCAFDECENYVRSTLEYASNVGFKQVTVERCTISNFIDYVEESASKGVLNNYITVVTIIGLIHELDPLQISGLLLSALNVLLTNGKLFIYDNDKLPDREPNAIPYRLADIESILTPVEGVSCKSHAIIEDEDFPSWVMVVKNITWDWTNTVGEKRVHLKNSINRQVEKVLLEKIDESRNFLHNEEDIRYGTSSEKDARDSFHYVLRRFSKMFPESI